MGKVNSDLEVRVQGRDDLSPALDRIESRLIRFVGAVGAGIAALRITSAPVLAAVELERELANVRKTTNFTSREMEQLNREVLRLSKNVDVSAKDLAKIAAAAGQQGLGREGVSGVVAFTESVARMSSVLDITAEEAADGMGKLVNIFKLSQLEYEKAISSFNEVSNNSTAKGSELLDVVRRIGDAAGNLNLQQSIALSATGLDFGQSPEVVGTAFAKVFSSLTQKAQDFGRLLYGTTAGATDKWLADLETDGLESFKKVLGALRELNPIDQQNTIIKLFGGGRIGALLNKLVQDSANVVLDRNFASARTGEQGFSAIQEQATVLNTVQAQAKIALNSLVAAGVTASDQLLGPLTSYLVRLQGALQSAEFQSFLNQVGRAVGQTLDLVDRVISAISDLGIVWTNFIPVIQVFLGLKLAEALAGMTARFLGLGSTLKSISKDARDASKGLNEASAAAATKRFSGGWFAERLGYRELFDEIQRTSEAKRAQAALNAQIEKSAQAAAIAQRRAEQVNATVSPAITARRSAAQSLDAATQESRRAMQRAADALFDIEQAKSQRLSQIAEQSEARRAAIEAQFQARRQAIAATGSRAGLRAAQRERDEALAAEEAQRQRQIRGVQAYWARREVEEARGATAAVAAATRAQQAAQARFDTANQRLTAVNAAQGSAANDAATAARTLETAQKASVALAATNAAAAAQGVQLGVLSVAWARITLVWRTATGVLSALGTALGVIARVVFAAFGWATLIYTLADAFGVLTPITGFLKEMAERLGILSKEKAQAAIDAEKHAAALDKERRAAEEAVKAYTELARGRSAADVAKRLADLADTAANPNLPEGDRQRAQEELSRFGRASQNALAEGQRILNEGTAKAAEEANVKLRAAQKNLDDATRNLERYQETVSRRVGDSGRALTFGEERTLERMSATVDAASAAYAKAKKSAEDLVARQKDVELGYERTRQDAESFNLVVQRQFTPQSAKLFKDYIAQYANYQDVVADAREQVQKLSSQQAGQDKVRQAELAAASDAERERGIAAAGAAELLRKSFDEELKRLLLIPKLSDDARNSLLNLKTFFSQNISSVPSFLAALKDADPNNLTGKGAPKPSSGTSGDGAFSPKLTGQESLSRRLRRAELEFARANNAAIADVRQEGYRQQQEIEDAAFERGLRGIDEYYQQREARTLAGIDAELEQRTADAQAARFEQEKPGLDAAERRRYDVDIARINGQIAVLIKRKEGIQAQTINDISRARDAFEQSVLSEKSRLSQEGLIPADTVAVYTRTLDALVAAQKDRLAKLRKDGQAELAAQLDDGAILEASSQAIRATGDKINALLSQLNQAKAQIEQQRKEGVLATAEAEQRIDASIESTTPVLQAMVAEMERFLDSITDADVRGSAAFQNLQSQVAGFRQSVVAANGELRSAAQTINRDISTQFAEVLVKMRGGIDGIRTGLSELANVVGNQILTRATQNIGDQIFKTIGGAAGKGGIGGFITDTLGLGAKADGSAASPFYVKQASDAGESVQEAIEASTSGTLGGLGELGSSIGSFFRQSDNSFLQTIGTLVSFLGAAFSSLITAIFTSSASEGASEGAGGILGAIFHKGGIVGRGAAPTRLVAPSVFSGATRYHSGGVIGLKPNEIPVIAEEGEEVLTEDDPRHRKNLTGEGASKSGGRVMNVWIVTPDQKSDIGPNDIVAVVADNMARGGSLKKLVQQIQIGK